MILVSRNTKRTNRCDSCVNSERFKYYLHYHDDVTAEKARELNSCFPPLARSNIYMFKWLYFILRNNRRDKEADSLLTSSDRSACINRGVLY